MTKIGQENIIINASGIKKEYECKSTEEGGTHKVEVLNHIDMTVECGEYISIMGRSGSGKTTLLKTLGMISLPTQGKILFKGRDTGELWADEIADIRRKEIGFVFQDFGLMDSLSALDNIMLPGIIDKKQVKSVREKAYELAESVELSRRLLEKPPYELSGGEKQRVAICRALINDPELLLADEPTGNLDETSRGMVADIFSDINVRMNKTIIMVTHDPAIAAMSGKVYMLRGNGFRHILKREGTQEQFYHVLLDHM